MTVTDTSSALFTDCISDVFIQEPDRLTYCFLQGSSHDQELRELIEQGADPNRLVPKDKNRLEVALQGQSDEFLVWVVEQGDTLETLKCEGWKRVLYAIITMRGASGIRLLDTRNIIPSSALNWAYVHTMRFNFPGVITALVNRGADLQGCLTNLLQQNLHNVAAEAFLKGLSSALLTVDEWMKLIHILVENGHHKSGTLRLNPVATERLLRQYCQNSQLHYIEALLRWEVNSTQIFAECAANSELHWSALTLLKHGADFYLDEIAKQRFILNVLTQLSIAELDAFEVTFPKIDLTKLLKTQIDLSSHIKIALLHLGADFEQTNLADLIKLVFEKREQAAEQLIYLMPKMNSDNLYLFLDRVVTARLVHYKQFKHFPFPSFVLNQRLIEFTKIGDLHAVRKLLLLGADVNFRDDLGKTALHYCLEEYHAQLVTFLLDAGADTACTDFDQVTPFQLAQKKGAPFFEIVATHEALQEAFTLFNKQPIINSILKRTATLQLARFYVTHLTSIKNHESYFAKRERYGSMHSIIYRKTGVGPEKTRCIYLLCKRSGTFYDTGSFNKVSEAIQIHLNSDLKPLSFRLMAFKISKKHLDRLSIENCELDRDLHAIVNQCEGIWKVEDAFTFNDRLISFSEEAVIFHRRGATLSLIQKVKAARFYTKGLLATHSHRIIHGDIKASNCLVKPGLADDVEAGWIDFGYGFRLDQDEPNWIILAGFYAVLGYTAPELFGVKPFRGNLQFVEIYALGCMLLSTLFGELFPMTAFLEHAYEMRNTKPITPIDRHKLRRMVYETVELPYQALAAQPKETLSPETELKLLFLQMMRLKAQDRIPLSDALNKLEQLLAAISPAP